MVDGNVQGASILDRYRVEQYYKLLLFKINKAEEQKEIAEKSKNKKG